MRDENTDERVKRSSKYLPRIAALSVPLKSREEKRRLLTDEEYYLKQAKERFGWYENNKIHGKPQ